MIRNSQLLIGTGLLAQLRVHAEQHGTGCAENSAELILGEARYGAWVGRFNRRSQSSAGWEE